MDQLKQDIAKLQGEVDRLTREKLEDRLRIISLEQIVQKENRPTSETVNKVLESGKIFVETVASHAVPVVAGLSGRLVALAQTLMKPRKKKRKNSALYSANSEKFL